jgi:3-oxoacyl-[acyl-carrier protein] reductase
MLGKAGRKYAEGIPLQRAGTPDEVGSVAVMLAMNGFITGQTIGVDGGIYMT